MQITDIKDPRFLKELNTKQMNELAQDIRTFLIESISKTGGHLASNLGVVELTIALHYVFDSPTDKIFFDVGHQSYVHKILTGRADKFHTLRQYNGLSGFQKRCESEHDVWEAGHSSTSLSAALGMAIARDLNQEDYCVVPVIGDGSMASGMSLEALNQIGSEKKKLIIIFNDNNMSISKNVGALTKNFSRLRAGKGYNDFKANLKNSLRKNNVGEIIYHGLKAVKDTLKETVVDKGIFGEFNLEYLGPVDGHNLKDLIQALETAKQYDEGPIVVHVITKKGKGYAPCEEDTVGSWHGVSSFEIETGKSLKGKPEGYKPWSWFMSDIVSELAEEDENILAVTPAMIHGSGLQRFFAKYPKRSFDCGIAEEHAATFCAALALSGKRPYFEVYSSFMQRAYDQINHDICRMDLPVVIGIDRAGLVGDDGETHHGVFDIGLLNAIPNMILAQPSGPIEARNLVYTAFHQDHPFAIRFPRGNVKDESGNFEMVEIGSWTILNKEVKPKVFIFAYGDDVEKIEEKVKINEIPAWIINCRFLKPMDYKMLDELAEYDVPMIVYETDMKQNGLGQSILAYYNQKNISKNMRSIGIDDVYIKHGGLNQLRKDASIDFDTLFRIVDEELKKC